MIWRKPEDLKYTDLCKWIDEHSHEIEIPGENKQTEDLIYNYLWLLVKALVIKKRMFENFSDYDGFAMHSANRLFFALRRSYANRGKIIKGKPVVPIKSILNYTKFILTPMKLEYLHDQYNLNLSVNEAEKQFDEFTKKQQVRSSVWETQGGHEEFSLDIFSLFQNLNYQLDIILKTAPFSKDSLEYKKLRISILLNCLNNIKTGKGLVSEPTTVIVWKLPKSMGNYVRLFLKKLSTQLKNEIVDSYNNTLVDDRILKFMISNQDGEFKDHEEQS